jgi:hypothetical protein
MVVDPLWAPNNKERNGSPSNIWPLIFKLTSSGNAVLNQNFWTELMMLTYLQMLQNYIMRLVGTTN